MLTHSVPIFLCIFNSLRSTNGKREGDLSNNEEVYGEKILCFKFYKDENPEMLFVHCVTDIALFISYFAKRVPLSIIMY